MNNGNTDWNNKNNNNNVRAVSEFQEKMINTTDITIEGFYEAYFHCRKNKSRTYSASQFEVDYEANLLRLFNEVCARTYQPERSIAFIVPRPIKREIFAAGFRDRIIHHWIAIRLEPLLESVFIDDTFNCRKGKGNSAGIAHVHEIIRKCSENYTRECWVMKLDLSGFFMSIDRELLTDKLQSFIRESYDGEDTETLLYLTRTVMLNAPEDHCIIKGSPEEWNDLPANKSLFGNRPGFGLPIGNLTSQLTANFLLNETDHYIRETLGLEMGRYVDDYCIVDPDKEKLLAAVPLIRKHLDQTAGVTLHPHKFYLQSYTKGVKFIGAVIKRDRIYIANRTVANAYRSIREFNRLASEPGYAEKNAEKFAASINSYLGIMKHYKSYAVRRRLTSRIDPAWFRVVDVASDCSKVIVKRRYKHRERIKYALKQQRKSFVKNSLRYGRMG